MLLRNTSEPCNLPEWEHTPDFQGPWRISADHSTFCRMDEVGQIYVLWIATGQISVI